MLVSSANRMYLKKLDAAGKIWRFGRTEDLDWHENKHESKEKRGGLNERKIWTDKGISMNLKKKKMGFWANGRFGLI